MSRQITPLLLALPSELIHHILLFLDLSDILSVSLVSRTLNTHTREETLWQPLVQAQLPYVIPKPIRQTWRDLFKQHHPYWYLTKRRIWFSDVTYSGKLIIIRYDHRINAIEGYRLVAERQPSGFEIWEYNPDVVIHTFNPKVQLDLNLSVIRLHAETYQEAGGDMGGRLQKDIPMNTGLSQRSYTSPSIFSQFMLTKPLPASATRSATPVWPPLTLPSPERTRNDVPPSRLNHASHRPATLQQMSTSTFRTRNWVQFASRGTRMSTRIGEGFSTWATLPEDCYTPTPEKPWQGIWVGDYSRHGCEFLVVIQPDHPRALPERAEQVLRSQERGDSDACTTAWTVPQSHTATLIVDSSEVQILEASPNAPLVPESPSAEGSSRVYSHSQEHPDDVKDANKGRIEAVKLTGDPNIPRGEFSFIAPDIGPDGLLRIANEEVFKGARVVRSVGHIASSNFHDDDYILSQLILISHDRIAQYWEAYGHISLYQRVDIDQFAKV